MARKFLKVPQPPIDRLGRRSESRPAWVGTVLAVTAALVIAAGAMKLHAVGEDGTVASMPETDLVRAVTRGGVKAASREHPPATMPATAGAQPDVPVKAVENPPDFCPT